jgi:hypothetical protein
MSMSQSRDEGSKDEETQTPMTVIILEVSGKLCWNVLYLCNLFIEDHTVVHRLPVCPDITAGRPVKVDEAVFPGKLRVEPARRVAWLRD